MVTINLGLKGDVPQCRAWIERVEPTQQAENEIVVLPDSQSGEIQQAFTSLVRQIRFRVFCDKGWGHAGKHKFQTGYDVFDGRKKHDHKKKNGG